MRRFEGKTIVVTGSGKHKGLGQAILQYLASIAAYPVTVFAARWLVGLRRVSPGAAERTRFAR